MPQDHDLPVACVIFRRGYKEGVVGRAPSFGDCAGLIEQSERLPGCGFDVAVKRVDVFAEQSPYDYRAMRFECFGCTLYVDVFGPEVQVAYSDGLGHDFFHYGNGSFVRWFIFLLCFFQ